MNPLWICFFTFVAGATVRLALQIRNHRHEKEASSRTQSFVWRALTPGETLVLSDHSPSTKAHVVLSDKGLHYLQEKENSSVHYSVTYAEIKGIAE